MIPLTAALDAARAAATSVLEQAGCTQVQVDIDVLCHLPLTEPGEHTWGIASTRHGLGFGSAHREESTSKNNERSTP